VIVIARAPSSASKSIRTTRLYDLMKIDEEMTSTVVKEESNHFKVK
jgi:hypothetical protein